MCLKSHVLRGPTICPIMHSAQNGLDRCTYCLGQHEQGSCLIKSMIANSMCCQLPCAVPNDPPGEEQKTAHRQKGETQPEKSSTEPHCTKGEG